ncbi:bactofilin family protein [Paramixta manurensis]
MFKRKELPVKTSDTPSLAAMASAASAPQALTKEPENNNVAPLPGPADATTIPANCVIIGEISASGDIHVNGTVEGKVRSDQTIFLLSQGKVSGEVNADKIVVNGVLTGLCSGREVEINASGLLDGTLECDTLSINKKGRFYGISRPLSGGDESDIKKPVDTLSTGSLTHIPESFLKPKEPSTAQES